MTEVSGFINKKGNIFKFENSLDRSQVEQIIGETLPCSHTHNVSDITDIPTKTSDLLNDSGFLTSHLDISGKVDKVTGKGLSTEDYTTEEKQKLSNIATGAQVNVIETVKVNGTSLTPTDKAVNILASSAPENNANKLITSKAVYDYLNILKTRINDALTEDYGISVYPYYSGSQKIYLDEEHTIDALYDSNTLYCREALTAFYNRAIVGDSIVLKKNGTPMKTVQITEKRSAPDGLILSADLIDSSMTFGTGEYNLYIVYA